MRRPTPPFLNPPHWFFFLFLKLSPWVSTPINMDNAPESLQLVDLLCIGAGPHTLTLLSRLIEQVWRAQIFTPCISCMPCLLLVTYTAAISLYWMVCIPDHFLGSFLQEADSSSDAYRRFVLRRSIQCVFCLLDLIRIPEYIY